MTPVAQSAIIGEAQWHLHDKPLVCSPDRRRTDSFLRRARWPFEQRDAAPAHPSFDGVAEEPHHPRQFDLDAHGIVQHFDPTGDPLPHCQCRKVQSVPLPVVIEPTEEDTQFALQAVDATVKPTPRLLPAEPVWDQND
jgi:hypothetical protein